MVFIKELHIKNCLSIKNLSLQFDDNNYATIFNFTSACGFKTKLIYAMQPFFCKDVANLVLEAKPDANLGPSIIRIKFLIPKEGTEDTDVVIAKLKYPNIRRVYYTINGHRYVKSLHVFHEQCQIDVSSYYPFLNKTCSNESKNLLHSFISSESPLSVATSKTNEVLACYLEISNSRPQSEQRRIAKLAETSLLIDSHYELLRKRTFIDVANEISRIFNYLTFEDYSVKFFFPVSGENINDQEVKLEDINFHDVETRVRKVDWEDPCVWNQLEPALRDLLKISQKIALAKHLSQKCIYIEESVSLQEYQNHKIIEEAIAQEDSMDSGAVWHTKNYIKQIVDICNEMKIMVFFNYFGILPLPPTNANIIMCRDPEDVDGKSIYIRKIPQPKSLDDFVETFKPLVS